MQLFIRAKQKLSDIKGILTALFDHKAGGYIERQETERLISQARSNLRFAQPYTECPKCRRKLEKTCHACKGHGWITEAMFSSAANNDDKEWLNERE